MRRFFLLAFLALLVIPAAVFAQDTTPEATSQAVWDLSQKFAVTDLGFQFNYPSGWVNDTSTGIKLAENQDDMDAIMDSDPGTNAKGYSIFVYALSLDALNMKADATLDDVVDTIVKSSGLTETESRVEVPIMTRRSVTVIGKNGDGRPGVANVWLQNGTVVFLSLGGPEINNDVGYTWGLLLGSVTPLNALELGDTPLASPNGDFTMSYPKDWFTDTKQPGAIAELEEDFSSSAPTPKGIAIIMIEAKLSDLSPDAKDLQSLGDFLRTTQGFADTVTPAEHIIMGQPALTYTGENPKQKGSYAIITALIRDGNAIIIGAFVPSEDKLTEFVPTYLAMLVSVKQVKS